MKIKCKVNNFYFLINLLKNYIILIYKHTYKNYYFYYIIKLNNLK